MNKLNKNQTIIIFLCVVIGVLIGMNNFVAEHASLFITPFLMLMLYGLFLNIPLEKLKQSFLNFKFSITSIVINFVFTPLMAYALGALFLSDHQSLWIGFIMLMVTPCTDWYMIFTGISKGNVPLSTSMLPINFILQVILLPVYLLIFFGNSGSLDLGSVLQSMAVVIVIPFGIAFLTKKIIRKEVILDKVKSFFESYKVIFLGVAIIAMFASEGQLMLDNLESIYILLLPVALFFLIIYFTSTIVAKSLKYSYEDYSSLVFIKMARNSPIALAIAVTAFADQPLIALSLIIGPLIELPVLAIVSQVQLWKKRRLDKKTK